MIKNKEYESDISKNAIEKEISSYRKWKGITWLRKTECSYKEKIVGYRLYEKDGTLSIEEPIKNGKIHGRVYYFYEDGALLLIEP